MMNWRDFLYFSKGERRALTLLLTLIVISWIILWLTDDVPPFFTGETTKTPVADTIVGRRDSILQRETASSPTTVKTSAPKKKDAPRKETKKTYEKKQFPRTEKYPVGTVVELNSADTIILKKVPGIGSTFARRIVKYRELLGGYHSVRQLSEVYGIDEEVYDRLKPWFIVDTSAIRKLPVNSAPVRELYRHPYLDSRQARIIYQMRRQNGKLTGWGNLVLLEEFTEADREKLMPYLSFE